MSAKQTTSLRTRIAGVLTAALLACRSCVRRRADLSGSEQVLRRARRRPGVAHDAGREGCAVGERRARHPATGRSRSTNGGTKRCTALREREPRRCFPQAIGMAATFDEQMMFEIATAISDEARAKHHEFARRGLRNRYQGLTFWSPNINIFRDPRWGRGQETYGEDPWLTSRMGVEFVKGLQGDDPKYRKVDATAKHYAVHSGPEADRHHFDVHPSERDLYETYLPAFQALVQEGGVALGDGRVQPRLWRVGVGEPAPAAADPAQGLGIQGLRRLRLRFDRRHLQASQDRRDRAAKPRRSACATAAISIAARPTTSCCRR